MKTLAPIVICFAISIGGAYGQQGPAVTGDPSVLIVEVQRTLASNLDSTLPPIALEEWIRGQIGSNANIVWVVRTGKREDFPWVEADISVGSQPEIVIVIACGKHNGAIKARPVFRSLQLVRQGEFAEWPHLHDLPVAMRKARGEG